MVHTLCSGCVASVGALLPGMAGAAVGGFLLTRCRPAGCFTPATAVALGCRRTPTPTPTLPPMPPCHCPLLCALQYYGSAVVPGTSQLMIVMELMAASAGDVVGAACLLLASTQPCCVLVGVV